MRVRDVLAALGRRWWVLLIGLLGTCGLLYAVYEYVPSTYEITSRVLLLPPDSTVLETGNPFLQLGGLREAVDMLGVSLTDQTTLLGLELMSKDAEVEVGADPTGSAPILLISVQDPSPDAARLIRDRLLGLVDSRLESIQKGIGVPVSNRVTSTIISSDVEAKVVGNNRLRAFVAAGGAGLALTMILAVLVDAALLRRRSRRQQLSLSDTGGPAGDEQHGDESLGDESLGDESLGDESLADESLGTESLGAESHGDESLGDVSHGDESHGLDAEAAPDAAPDPVQADADERVESGAGTDQDKDEAEDLAVVAAVPVPGRGGSPRRIARSAR